MRRSLRRSRLLAAAAVTVVLAAGAACSGPRDAWRSSGHGAADRSDGRLAVSLTSVAALGPAGGPAALSVTVLAASGRSRPAQVFVDSDGDRDTGMWSFQSPLSGSGWDLLVDGEGRLYEHAGPADAWDWEPVKATGFRRTVSPGRMELSIPGALLKAPSEDVRVAAESDGDWYPAAFLPGMSLRGEAVVSRTSRSGPPASLAIFYGHSPWLVRDCRVTDPVACPARAFAEFAHVVLGSGLEEPDHPSHARTRTLIREIRSLAPSTELWGYVSLVGGPASGGVRPVLYTVAAIRDRAVAWKEMGITGVFLDEADLCRPARDDCAKDSAGTEFEVTRARQAAVVAAVHELGMPVFANGFAVPEVLGPVDDVPSPLTGARDGRRADMYLLENLTVSAGRRVSGFDAQVGHARLQLALRLATPAGVRVAAVDTVREPAPDLASAPAFYRDGLVEATKAGLDAYGFTNSSYSSEPATATSLPAPPTAPGLGLAQPCTQGAPPC
jgi:hypothetical protein